MDSKTPDGSRDLALAASALDAGNVDQAAAIYARLYAGAADGRAAYLPGLALAACHARRRRWIEGEALLLTLVERYPASGMARAYLGGMRLELERFDDARADLDLAISIAPGEAIVYIKRGELLLRLGLLRGAMQDFQQALRLPAPDEVTRDYCRSAVLSLRQDISTSVERRIPSPSSLWRRFRSGAPEPVPAPSVGSATVTATGAVQ